MSAIDRAGLLDAMADYAIPQHLVEGLERYLCDHIPPGHFLLAILRNDLTEAVNRADEDSRKAIGDLVAFLGNTAPAGAWGSPERVRIWLEGRPRR